MSSASGSVLCGRLISPESVIVLPTFDEAENVEAICTQILAASPRVCVLVVDDASPDGTGTLVDRLCEERAGKIACLHRPGKLGLGTAYLDGFRLALAWGAELVLEMDADFSHPPRFLPAMLEAASGADLVLGSRYVPGGRIVNWDGKRRVLSQFGSRYARWILSSEVRDWTGGFKCYRSEVLKSIDLDTIRSRGYAFQVETTYRALLAGFRVHEMPITFEERKGGASKMSRRIVLEAAWRVWSFRMRQRALRRRCQALREELAAHRVGDEDSGVTADQTPTSAGASA